MAEEIGQEIGGMFPYPANRGCHCKPRVPDEGYFTFKEFPYPANRGCHCKPTQPATCNPASRSSFHTLLIAGVTARVKKVLKLSTQEGFHTLLIAGVTASEKVEKIVSIMNKSFHTLLIAGVTASAPIIDADEEQHKSFHTLLIAGVTARKWKLL